MQDFFGIIAFIIGICLDPVLIVGAALIGMLSPRFWVFMIALFLLCAILTGILGQIWFLTFPRMVGGFLIGGLAYWLKIQMKNDSPS